jgi:hypothetical protein
MLVNLNYSLKWLYHYNFFRENVPSKTLPKLAELFFKLYTVCCPIEDIDYSGKLIPFRLPKLAICWWPPRSWFCQREGTYYFCQNVIESSRSEYILVQSENRSVNLCKLLKSTTFIFSMIFHIGHSGIILWDGKQNCSDQSEGQAEILWPIRMANINVLTNQNDKHYCSDQSEWQAELFWPIRMTSRIIVTDQNDKNYCSDQSEWQAESFWPIRIVLINQNDKHYCSDQSEWQAELFWPISMTSRIIVTNQNDKQNYCDKSEW